MTTRFCRDCRWAIPTKWFFIFKDYEFAKCHHPKIGLQPTYDNLVTGHSTGSEYWFCSTNRFAPCGEEGRYWEPRQ